VNRGLIWSGGLHLTVFLVFLLGPGPKPFEWDRADAVPVDLVSLPVEIPAPKPVPPKPAPIVPDPVPVPEAVPEEIVPEKAPPPEKPADPKPVQQAPKPKPEPPPRVFKKYAPPRSDDEPSLAERLRERLEQAAERPQETPPAETQPAEAAPAPAAPAEATASVEAVNFPYEWYLNVLRTKIFAAWDPPGERLLAGHRRHVVVRFRIHRDGSITDIRIDGASGTPGLDTSARRAIERGGPYPPLPPAYEEDRLDLGVRFTVTEGGS
jgi:protein TonB